MDIPWEISTLIQVKRRQLCLGIRLKWHTLSKVSNSSKISFAPQALKSIYTSWEMTYRKCATPSQFWITGRNRILHYDVADFNSFWSFLKGTSPPLLPTWRPLQASHEKQSKESDGKWLCPTASIFCWKPTPAEKQKQATRKNLKCLWRRIVEKSKHIS